MTFQQIQDKVKSFINSIRIPSLLSFFISKEGKINPTIEETLAEAPKASENWVRLALGKVTSIGLPVWLLFAILIGFGFWEKFWAAIAFLAPVVSNFGILIILGGVGYFIWKSWPRSK